MQLAHQDLCQLGPALVALEDSIERAQGAQVVAVLLEDLGVRADRLVVVADHVLVQLSDLELDVAALARIAGQVQLAAVDAEQLAVVTLGRVQALERLQRLAVAWLDGQDGGVGLERAVDLAQLALLHPRRHLDERQHLGRVGQ
jgi:hypothetical protein